jgi:hypothetical protein
MSLYYWEISLKQLIFSLLFLEDDNIAKGYG